MLRAFGFIGGAGLRLVGAAGFAAIALLGVWLVERGGDPPAITAALPAAATARGRLVLETTYPVATWSVQVQGRVVMPALSTAQRWEGEVSGDPATIYVAAEPADAISAAAGALRWQLAGRNGVLWGEGVVSGTLAEVGR